MKVIRFWFMLPIRPPNVISGSHFFVFWEKKFENAEAQQEKTLSARLLWFMDKKAHIIFLIKDKDKEGGEKLVITCQNGRMESV